MTRKKVNFVATKKITKKKKVSFHTKEGIVSFWTTEKVPKKVKVKFYIKPKKASKKTVSRALK